MAAVTPLYERLPSESSAAYHAFTVYRSLGIAERSLAEVSRRLVADNTGSRIIFENQAANRPQTGRGKRASGNVNHWSKKFNWVKRAAAWDDAVDERLRARQLDEIEKMAQRHAQSAQITDNSVVMGPIMAYAKALRDPVNRDNVINLVTGPLRELLEMGQRSASLLPRIHEAERRSRGIRIDRKKTDSPQGGLDWLITVHQPERKDPVDLTIASVNESPEWAGDPGGKRDDDEYD